MKFRSVWLAGVSGALIGGGCSAITSFAGLATAEDAAAPAPDANLRTADGATREDATAQPIDAGAPTVCSPSATITAAFTADMGKFSPFSTVQSYPNVESFYGDTALTLLPFRDTTLVDAGPDADPVPKQTPYYSSHSGAWLTSPLPLTSFDVSFDAQIRCTSAGSCADGLIFAWLDTQDSELLKNKNLGSGAGLPAFVGGAGVDLDNYKNDPSEANDPYTPSLQIIQLDAMKTPGLYPWQKAIEKLAFADAWHTIAISQRSGNVTLSFDGVTQLTANVTVVTSGLIGLTAGVGGQSDAVAVRKFSGTFYDCVAK